MVATAKILVVDDDEEYRDLLSRCLKRRGYTVRTAEDVDAAIEELERDSYAIVTVDMKFETGSTEAIAGEDLLIHLRENYEGIRCIVVSGSPEVSKDEAADFGRKYGARFVEKQKFNATKFAALVKEVLQEVGVVRSGGGESMRAKHEELIDKEAEVQAINETLADITQLFEDGELDRDHYSRKLRKWRRDRNKLISEIQIILEDTEAAELGNLLEQAKGEKVEEDEIKTEVKQIADEKGWGDKVLEQIDKHKGEIVSLIVAIAIELGKRAIA